MTDYDNKETSVGSWLSDRDVSIRKTHARDRPLLTITAIRNDVQEETIFAYLSPDNAYALVDWITENVERPRVKTDVEVAFEKLDVGTIFGFYYPEEIPTRWPYKKVSETEYARLSDYDDDVATGIPKDIKGAGSGAIPTARPAVPTLSVKDKIDALKVGAKFQVGTAAPGAIHFIKTGDSSFVRVWFDGKQDLFKDAFGHGNYGRWRTDFTTEVTEID